MPLELSSVMPEDAAALSDLQWAAFESDPGMRTVCALPPPQEARDWLAGSIVKGWFTRERKVVKDTDLGEMVSQLAYNFTPAMSGEGWKKFTLPPRNDVPKSMNLRTLDECAELDWKSRVELMGSQPFIYFISLSTSPKHERRGGGRMLMEFITQEADRRNLPIFLVATPQGHGLYLRHGFEDKGEYEYDLSSVNEPPRKGYAMVRAAPRPGEPVDFPIAQKLPVKVVPIEPTMKDLTEFDNCSMSALGPNPLIELCFFGAEQEPQEHRVAHEIKRAQSDDFFYHKAIDPSNPQDPPLGIAKWMLARDPHVKMHPFSENWPPGANVACCEAMFGKLTKFREDYFKQKNKPYAYMSTLAVAPHAQRRGIGSTLLREGLEKVDELGWDAFIDATQAGLGLYKKFGWEVVFHVTVNLKDFGGPDVEETSVCLIRPPGAKEKKLEDVQEVAQDLSA